MSKRRKLEVESQSVHRGWKEPSGVQTPQSSHPSRQSALGTAGSRLEGAGKGGSENREKTDYSESGS